MARTKKITGAVGAIALAIMVTVGIFAFKADNTTKVNKASKYANAWYVYQLTSYTKSEVQDPSNYLRTSSTPGCAQSTNICAVQLTDNGPGSNPTFTSTNQTDLWNAQQHLSTPGYIKLKN